jgi:hypothetical protein
MELPTPQISNLGYASNALDLQNIGSSGNFSTITARRIVHPALFAANELSDILGQSQQQQENLIMPQTTRRIVQVFIADPNENVPLDQSLIFKGEQKLTDATDQELFFEINIAPLLDEYNKKRVTFTDKEASKRSGKDIFLEPVRIRDLRMVVTDIAKF